MAIRFRFGTFIMSSSVMSGDFATGATEKGRHMRKDPRFRSLGFRAKHKPRLAFEKE